MTPAYVLMIFFYWLFLSAVIFVAGAFASRIFVTGPSGADVCFPYGKKKCLGDTACLIIFLASIFALITNAIHLVFHASVMTETPLGEVFPIVPVFLAKTKYGQFTLIRTALLLAVVLVSCVSLLRSTRAVTFFGVLISIALLATLSMSGHKGVEGYLSVPFALDMLHILSVSLWIGGLFFLILCFSFLLREAGTEFWGTFRAMINRFSDLATYCVAIALITGAGLSLYSIKSPPVLIETQYGVVLVVKTLLAVSIFLLGGINKFLLLPRLNRSGKDDWQRLSGLRSRLHKVVAVEAYLGVAVLLATSLLTHLSPQG